jgi:hypothetical protein
MKFFILALSFIFFISSCTSGGSGINRFSSDAEVAAYNATADYYDQYVCGFEERPGRTDFRRNCYKRIRLLDRQYTIDEVFDASTL